MERKWSISGSVRKLSILSMCGESWIRWSTSRPNGNDIVVVVFAVVAVVGIVLVGGCFRFRVVIIVCPTVVEDVDDVVIVDVLFRWSVFQKS